MITFPCESPLQSPKSVRGGEGQSRIQTGWGLRSVATFTLEICRRPLTRCSRVALSVHALSSAHLQHVILQRHQTIDLTVCPPTGPPAATQRESWRSPSRGCGLCVELELRDDATTGIMLFNAHSFSDDHCCLHITRRLCRLSPGGPSRICSCMPGPCAGLCGAAWCGAPCPVTTGSAGRAADRPK